MSDNERDILLRILTAQAAEIQSLEARLGRARAEFNRAADLFLQSAAAEQIDDGSVATSARRILDDLDRAMQILRNNGH